MTPLPLCPSPSQAPSKDNLHALIRPELLVSEPGHALVGRWDCPQLHAHCPLYEMYPWERVWLITVLPHPTLYSLLQALAQHLGMDETQQMGAFKAASILKWVSFA